mgnify:CR=1 FL=1
MIAPLLLLSSLSLSLSLSLAILSVYLDVLTRGDNISNNIRLSARDTIYISFGHTLVCIAASRARHPSLSLEVYKFSLLSLSFDYWH